MFGENYEARTRMGLATVEQTANPNLLFLMPGL